MEIKDIQDIANIYKQCYDTTVSDILRTRANVVEDNLQFLVQYFPEIEITQSHSEILGQVEGMRELATMLEKAGF